LGNFSRLPFGFKWGKTLTKLQPDASKTLHSYLNFSVPISKLKTIFKLINLILDPLEFVVEHFVGQMECGQKMTANQQIHCLFFALNLNKIISFFD
jgi:hypothetical protein